MAYSTNDKGEIVLTLSRDDYDRLLLALGFATMAAMQAPRILSATNVLGLMNRMLDGSPNFTPYEVPEIEQTNSYGFRER